MTSVGVPLLQAPVARAGMTASAPSTVRGDFNNDGYADIAIGAPLDGDTFESQGAVQVIYGSATGLDPVAGPDHPGNQLLFAPPADAQDLAGFGLALAVGDFDGDSFGDLAVGANGENGAIGDNEGSVTVFYGSGTGLVSSSAQRLTEAAPAPGNQFGFFVAAGDFNGDGHDDLAVDVLNKVVSGVRGAGAVLIFPGSTTGLVTSNPAQLDAERPGTTGVATEGAQFGSELAAGDVNGDGRTDLAVAAPFDTVKGVLGAGAVHVFFGCSAGPTCTMVDTATDQYISQGPDFVPGDPGLDDAFGLSLAMGDFGRGPGADIAIGIPGKDVRGVENAGAVQVFYSNGSVITGENILTMSQGNGWIADTAEPHDRFGSVIVAGNLGRSPQAELVIGTTFEDVGPLTDAGVIQVVYGTPEGLTKSASQLLTQDIPGIKTAATAGYGFGKSLAIANFGYSDEGDLAVASRDTVTGQAGAGAVTVMYGSAGRIARAEHVQYWTQDSAGMLGVAEPGDILGGAHGQPGLAG